MLILHVAARAEWETAQTSGSYTGNTLSKEGFIHCCTPDQLMHVLIRHYPNVVNHVIAEIDTSRVKSEIRWEGSPETFPHIYGPLNMDAVTRFKALW